MPTCWSVFIPVKSRVQLPRDVFDTFCHTFWLFFFFFTSLMQAAEHNVSSRVELVLSGNFRDFQTSILNKQDETSSKATLLCV